MEPHVSRIDLHDNFEPPIIEAYVDFSGGIKIMVSLEMKDYSLTELRREAIAKATEAMRRALA
jgi:hypothetical protein